MTKGQGKNKSGLFPILIFTGVVAVVAPPTMLVMAVGMVPSLVAAFVNPGRVRGSIAAMFAFNLAGVIPAVGFLWQRGHTLDNAFRLLADPFMLLLLFGGAGIAAALLWAVPIAIHAGYEVQAKGFIKRFQKRRASLIKEWGGQIIEDSKIQPAAIKR